MHTLRPALLLALAAGLGGCAAIAQHAERDKVDVVNAVTHAIRAIHGPGMGIVPLMSTGASDGSFFRAKGVPVYDVDGSWGIAPDDDRAHGLDERIPVRAMYDDVVHWEMVLKELAGR